MKHGSRAIIIRGDKLLAMERHNKGRHYFALIGGAIDPGETKEQALVREVKEETGLDVVEFIHVFSEDLGERFGLQYVFLCDDPGGEPRLAPDSIEAKLNKQGENIFKPVWLPVEQLSELPLMSPKMKDAIITAVKNTFPESPQNL